MSTDLTTQLKRLNRVSRVLMKSTSLKDIKAIRDQAEAIHVLAKSVKADLAMRNQAGELKLRAERRAGNLLSDAMPHGGNRRNGCNCHRATLAELGISFNQSSRWRREAAVPEELFQRYITEANQKGEEVTSAGLLRLVRTNDSPAKESFLNGVVSNTKMDAKSSPASNGQSTRSMPEHAAECRQLLVDLNGHRNLLQDMWGTSKGETLAASQQRLVSRLLAEMQSLIESLEHSLFGERKQRPC